MIPGLVIIPGAAGGSIIGGTIAKYFKLDVIGLLRMCIILISICLATMTAFLLKCDMSEIAGVTTAYRNDM